MEANKIKAEGERGRERKEQKKFGEKNDQNNVNLNWDANG